MREVYLKSRQLSLQKYQKPTFGEDDYIDFYKKKNRKKFNSQQLEAFRLLFAWRDQIARSEDECTDYVIPGIDCHIACDVFLISVTASKNTTLGFLFGIVNSSISTEINSS